ncbi:MAG: 50S ribosomal protein L5 [Vampirovibrionales bacterium]|nr:50S ribosomal protein L5 [Vampirovibrionales bacterium]
MASPKSLKDRYLKDIVPALMKDQGYTNALQVPRVQKVVINIGVGDGAQNVKILDAAVRDLTAITGQKPVVTRAKKSVAGFKVREGMPIGLKVTLRGDRMYYFLAKLNGVALPRVRDFRGLSDKGFDGRGNYNIGLRDQLIFPEINYDKVEKVRGMNITICTSARTDMEARALLAAIGTPFKRSKTEAAPVAAAS